MVRRGKSEAEPWSGFWAGASLPQPGLCPGCLPGSQTGHVPTSTPDLGECCASQGTAQGYSCTLFVKQKEIIKGAIKIPCRACIWSAHWLSLLIDTDFWFSSPCASRGARRSVWSGSVTAVVWGLRAAHRLRHGSSFWESQSLRPKTRGPDIQVMQARAREEAIVPDPA